MKRIEQTRFASRLRKSMIWAIGVTGSTLALLLFSLLLFQGIFAFAIGRTMNSVEQAIFFFGAIGLMAFSIWILKKT